MIDKLKSLALSLTLLLGSAAVVALPVAAHADIAGSLCGAATTQTVDAGSLTPQECQTKTAGGESHFDKILSDIINIFSIIVGITAVIMIVYAGFRYVTSGGNQESVKSAKQTLIYALIGLVIVALAQVIVKFVLHQAINPSSSSSTGTTTCVSADHC